MVTCELLGLKESVRVCGVIVCVSMSVSVCVRLVVWVCVFV